MRFFIYRGSLGEKLGWGAAACLFALGALTACSGGGGKKSAGGPQEARVEQGPTLPEQPRFKVLSQEIQSTGTLLRLSWPGGVKPPESAPVLGICLPANRQISARWLEVRINGEPVKLGGPAGKALRGRPAQNPPLREYAGVAEFAGYVRHWPIYRLQLDSQIYERLRQAQPGSPDPELTLALSWREPYKTQAAASTRETPGQESWRKLAERLVINGEALKAFAVDKLPEPKAGVAKVSDPRRLAPRSRSWARLHVSHEGPVRLDTDELIKVGFPAEEVKAEAVRVFSHGQAVPLLIAPSQEAPKALKPGVYFWAQGSKSQYTTERIYWVTLGPELPPARLEPARASQNQNLAGTSGTVTLSAVPRSMVRDEDQLFQTHHGDFLAIEGMEWVEGALKAGKPLNVPLAFPYLIPQGKDLAGELEFFIDRETALGQFRVEVEAGGKKVATLHFANTMDKLKAVRLPESCVKDGRTTLTLRLVDDGVNGGGSGPEGDTGSICFDRARFGYASAARLVEGRLTLASDRVTTQTAWVPLWDLNQGPGDKPPLLAWHVGASGEVADLWPIQSGGQGEKGILWPGRKGERLEFFDARTIPDAPSLEPAELDDLTGENQGADLLIISHSEFMDAARKLADFHRGEGWSVRVVDVQNVYDSFSDGELTPQAIKDFLGYTLRRWKQGAPTHVLLVGDCTSDYLNVSHSEVRNWVPTYTYPNGTDKWASDYWFTTVAGEDNFGDLMIGRLSVANRADAQAVVDKIVDYATTVKPGPWQSRLAYVADDGEFGEVVDQVIKEDTPAAYGVERIFLSELPLEDNWYLARDYVERKRMKVSRAATRKILDTFEKGVSVMTYYGHGSPNIWADERIWFGGDSPNSDNRHLAGSGQYTFIANMTCNSGAIDYPLAPWNICITEDMMRVPKGGAIACYVPSGPGVTTIHREMSRSLRRSLFENRLRRLGEATTFAKFDYAMGRHPEELIYMYILLGDPLLSLKLTENEGKFRLDPDVFTPGSELAVTLKGITPEAGQWRAEVADEQGRVLWTSQEAAYQGGTVKVAAKLPEAAKAGKANLRVYCWDPQAKSDMALAGSFTIQRPSLTLDALTVEGANGSPKAVIKISNPTRLEAQGELEVRTVGGATAKGVKQTTVTVEGGQSKTIEADLPARPENGAAVVEAQLKLAATGPWAPDDLTIPQVAVKRAFAGAAKGWTGWIEPLCSLERRERSNTSILHATAVLPDEAGVWIGRLKTAPGAAITSQTLMREMGGDRRLATATFNLDTVAQMKARGGSLTFERAASPSPTGKAGALNLAMNKLARGEARLRIVPGSIHYQPKRPTEGETVFVDFEIENQGSQEAEPATMELLDAKPGQGGKELPNNGEDTQQKTPRLGPGRRTALTLRWDPQRNAGKQTIWVHLMVSYGGDSEREVNDVRPLEVTALTKPALGIGRTWADASAKDLQEHQIMLKAQVRNSGQTAAYRVMISFYRSHLQTPENKLGEVEVKEVPGKGSADAVFVWHYDPLRDLIKGTQMPEPTVQVWLKGSSQRLSSASGGMAALAGR